MQDQFRSVTSPLPLTARRRTTELEHVGWYESRRCTISFFFRLAPRKVEHLPHPFAEFVYASAHLLVRGASAAVFRVQRSDNLHKSALSLLGNQEPRMVSLGFSSVPSAFNKLSSCCCAYTTQHHHLVVEKTGWQDLTQTRDLINSILCP